MKAYCAACGVYTETRSYEYGPGSSKRTDGERNLCVLCSNTYAGNAEAFPGQYEAKEVMVHINQVANLFAHSMGIELKDLPEEDKQS